MFTKVGLTATARVSTQTIPLSTDLLTPEGTIEEKHTLHSPTSEFEPSAHALGAARATRVYHATSIRTSAPTQD
jgi:hypothetical protein